MRFESLVQFTTIVQKGSISEAARSLNTSQPALSMQLRNLEEELGVQLLVREHRRVLPTAAGEALLQFAGRVLEQERQFRDQLSALDGKVAGKIVISTGETSGIYIAPWVVGAFCREYPDVSITMNVLHSVELNQVLQDHLCDFALTATDLSGLGYETVKFLEDSWELILPRSHPWAGRESLSLEEVWELPLILRDDRSSSGKHLERILAQHQVETADLRVLFRLGSNEAIKTAVEAGLGAGFVSRCSLRPTDTEYVRMPIQEMKFIRPIWLVRNPAREMTFGAKRLWDFVQSDRAANLLPQAGKADPPGKAR